MENDQATTFDSATPATEASQPTPQKKPRGFAAISPERRREISALGGKAAHQLGRAHTFNHDEAVKAGRIGGQASRRKTTQE